MCFKCVLENVNTATMCMCVCVYVCVVPIYSHSRFWIPFFPVSICCLLLSASVFMNVKRLVLLCECVSLGFVPSYTFSCTRQKNNNGPQLFSLYTCASSLSLVLSVSVEPSPVLLFLPISETHITCGSVVFMLFKNIARFQTITNPERRYVFVDVVVVVAVVFIHSFVRLFAFSAIKTPKDKNRTREILWTVWNCLTQIVALNNNSLNLFHYNSSWYCSWLIIGHK